MINDQDMDALVGQFVRHLKTGQRGRVVKVLDYAAHVVEVYCTDGTDAAMNAVNLELIPRSPITSAADWQAGR